MLVRTETFKLGDAEITVQGATGLSELDKNELNSVLKNKTGRGEVHNDIYAEIVAQTVEAKNTESLGFKMPSVTASVPTHVAAFKKIMGLPLDYINLWLAAINRVNAAPNTDPDLQPDVVSDDPKSSESGNGS